jgi:hypothetical protein
VSESNPRATTPLLARTSDHSCASCRLTHPFALVRRNLPPWSQILGPASERRRTAFRDSKTASAVPQRLAAHHVVLIAVDAVPAHSSKDKNVPGARWRRFRQIRNNGAELGMCLMTVRNSVGCCALDNQLPSFKGCTLCALRRHNS